MKISPKGLNIEFSEKTPKGVETLIKETVYGREGKLQYKHKYPLEKLAEIDRKLIFSIKKNDKIINCAVFVERQTRCIKQNHLSFYIRYLSFNKSFKTSRNKQPFNEKRKVSDGSLRNQIKTYYTEFFTSHINKSHEKAVFYAYIESENFSSYGIAELLDYIVIRQLRTLVFSRFSPKHSSIVSLIEENEKETIIKNLNEFYKNYSFFSTQNIFLNGNYYVLKVNNEIIAGIKASKVSWEILKIPGLRGFLMQSVFPLIPYLSRLFKSNEMNFVAFEAVWFKEGSESRLLELMESVCSSLKSNIGILWFDKSCTIGESIYKTKKLGLLNKLKENVSADVIFNHINLTEQEVETYKNSPAYISSFDLT